MLSLSALIPSVIQDQIQKVGITRRESNAQSQGRDEQDLEHSASRSDADAMATDEQGSKRKERNRNANETFIVVRPPPSKTNHPLNLQVQLVPPNARSGQERSSAAGTRPDSTPGTPNSTAGETFSQQQQDDAYLTRTASVGSDATSYSYSNSVSSFASTTSSGSGRRMIIPLYNLQAHNVMTNLVVDAGTDAKIAKFLKRGLELIGLALLEPIEVYGYSGTTFSTLFSQGPLEGGQGSSFSTKDGFLHTVQYPSRPTTPDRAHTPTSSALSVSSAGLDVLQRPNTVVVDPSPTATTSGPKKLFGKFFNKKKDPPSSLAPPPSSPPPAAPQSPTRTSRHSKRLSTSFSNPLTISPSIPQPPTSPAPFPPTAALGAPVLGIQPTLSLPSSRRDKDKTSFGRPTMYVWVIRKWLKGGEGILNGLATKLGGKDGNVFGAALGLGGGHVAGGMVEVTFEWKRGRRKESERRKRAISGGGSGFRRGSLAVASGSGPGGPGSANGGSKRNSWVPQSNSNAASTTSLEHGAAARTASPQRTQSQKKANRLSTHSVSQHSVTTNTTSENGGERERERGEREEVDGGEESDPEDSETPWSCTLKIRRLETQSTPQSSRMAVPPTPNTPSYASDSFKRRAHELPEKDADLRLKVAVLSPTPHHPKVVALLKVPFPLPDVEIDKAELRPRHVGAGHHVGNNSGGGVADILMLTAEEIKDVVSSTGLWLVVREGFGGVGKVNRKGDGWRIRG